MAFEKPKFLNRYQAEAFQDESVVAVYHMRPPYPEETFEVLGSLVLDQPGRVLDVGCGLGDIARHMLPYAEHIDAIDFSPGMVRRGRMLPDGDDDRIRWQCSTVEEADLDPPYSIITAGRSIGWFDLNTMMPQFASMLTPDGYLASVGTGIDAGLDDLDIITEYSVNRDYIKFNMVDALVKAGLFRVAGSWQTAAVPWRPTVEDFIDFRHSQNGFSKSRMGPDRAAAFGKAERERIRAQHEEGAVKIDDGRLQGTVVGDVVWGKLLEGAKV